MIGSPCFRDEDAQGGIGIKMDVRRILSNSVEGMNECGRRGAGGTVDRLKVLGRLDRRTRQARLEGN